MEVLHHPRHHRFLLLTSLLAVIGTAKAEYKTYTVERDCGSGNMTTPLAGIGATSAALLRATDRTSYSLSMDCRILVAAEGRRVVVSVREIGFRRRADGACRDYLQIAERPMCANLFRKDEERHFYSEGDSLEMRYHVSQEGTDNSTLTGHPGFQVVATAYTTGECSDRGAERMFRCDNGLCVWAGLKCDTHNNCGDLSDERECGGPGADSSTSVLIILGVLILLLLLIMCIATLLCSRNENVRRFSNRIRTRTLSFVRRFSR